MKKPRTTRGRLALLHRADEHLAFARKLHDVDGGQRSRRFYERARRRFSQAAQIWTEGEEHGTARCS